MQRHQPCTSSASKNPTSPIQVDAPRRLVIPPDLRVCPDCGKETKILVSESENNPGGVYIKCKTFRSKLSKCKFFIWEDEMEESVHDEIEPEVSSVNTYGAQYDVEMEEWKKQNSQLISLAEKLKFLVTLIVVLMVVILIVMLCK